MRKGVSDLHRRGQVSQACNDRYLDGLAAASLEEKLKETAGDICEPTMKNGRRYRAMNPWQQEDYTLLEFLAQGERTINGFRNRDLRTTLYPECERKGSKDRKRASNRVTRRIMLMRAHGLIKKVPKTNRYVLTAKGRTIVTAVLAASHAGTEQLMDLAA